MLFGLCYFIINFISPIGSQHKNTKAKAQQQQTKEINYFDPLCIFVDG